MRGAFGIAFPVVLIGGFLLSAPCPAQQSSSASPAGERPAFHGGDISAAISGITVTGNGYRTIRIQMALKNNGPGNIYLAGVKGQIITGSSSNGVGFSLADTYGLMSCTSNTDPNEQISACAKTFPKEDYVEVDAGQPLITTLVFNTMTIEEPKGTISFALRLLVRPAPGNANTLEAMAAEQPKGPARVVTINFPLVPLDSD